MGTAPRTSATRRRTALRLRAMSDSSAAAPWPSYRWRLANSLAPRQPDRRPTPGRSRFSSGRKPPAGETQPALHERIHPFFNDFRSGEWLAIRLAVRTEDDMKKKLAILFLAAAGAAFARGAFFVGFGFGGWG